MSKKPPSKGLKEDFNSSLLGAAVRRFGWGKTIAVVVVVGLALQLMPKGPPRQHHRPHQGQHSPTPAGQALNHWLDELRLTTKRMFFDPAYEDYQRKHKHRRGEPSFPPIALANMRFTLGPRRIFAAQGDKDVPPHREDHQQADRQRFQIAYGTGATSTTVFFFLTEENVAPQPLKAAAGVLTLRDKTGEALYRQLWHFPNDHPGALLKDHVPFHTTFADSNRSTSTWNFRKLLYTQESELTLQWSPLFVCYADDTMEGDVARYLALYGNDLHQDPVLKWLAKLQYPNGVPSPARRGR